MHPQPLGDHGHLATRFRRDHLDAIAIAQVARALVEAGERIGQPSRATAAGDWRKLRGIPAVGRGVPGAIIGSRP